MKKTLFVIPTLNLGGSVTSLLNLLELLDASGNRADLFVLEHTGVFLERAKKCANLLPESKKLASVLCRSSDLKKYGIKGFLNRCLASLKYKLFSPSRVRDQIYRKVARTIKEYDTVVAYQESISTQFTQFIPAKKRIAWVHTMYDRFAGEHDKMLSLYSNFESVVCVAPAAADAFKAGLPELKDRVLCIPNTLNPTAIQEKSLLYEFDTPQKETNVIVSVGRLSPEKQYDHAILAAKKLNEQGVDFTWYIIGEGKEKEKLTSLIEETNLTSKVILLGGKENPYPIIAKADVLVISSLYEAQPMVANEALILNVPVITTDYPSAKTLINHNTNGLICENSTEGIACALYAFFTEKTLKDALKTGAKEFTYDTQSILERIFSLCSID